MKKHILNLRIQKLGICMRNKICFGMGATLAFAMSVYAQNYKINKVGTDEEKSFNVLLNETVVGEASAGSWLNIDPIVPDGKVFMGFTVYDEYGDTREQRRVSTTEKKDSSFLMPYHDVFVSASFESLRYFLNVKNTDNGTITLVFNDRYRDRTKPGTKVTVNPNAANGYKVASITVSRYLDASTTVPCVKNENGAIGSGVRGIGAVEGSCSFDMPEFDVEVTALFVDQSVDLSSSSSEEVSSSSSVAESSSSSVESSSNVEQSSSSEIVSSSSVESSSSSAELSSSSAQESSNSVTSSSSSAKSSSSQNSSSSSSKEVSSSSVKTQSSSSSKTESSSSVKSSSSKNVSSSSKQESSSSTKSSSSVKSSSSSAKQTSSSSVKQSSSSTKSTSSSSAKSVSSSSSAKVVSSSSVKVSSSSAKAASSSSAKSVSSSSTKQSSSSSAKASSSSSSKKASSSSAKPASSSSKKSASSSSKAVSSSSVIPDIVVEAVGTEEDMPSCTVKRENMTYYVTELKTVFVCKNRVWEKFNPGTKLALVANVAKFSALVNGRNLQISGAKVGSDINLLDMQGRVIYNGRVGTTNFSMQAPGSGSYLLRIGTQQKVVNVR